MSELTIFGVRDIIGVDAASGSGLGIAQSWYMGFVVVVLMTVGRLADRIQWAICEDMLPSQDFRVSFKIFESLQ